MDGSIPRDGAVPGKRRGVRHFTSRHRFLNRAPISGGVPGEPRTDLYASLFIDNHAGTGGSRHRIWADARLFRPAKPGDSIVIYGIGFGEVTPPSAPGVIVAEQNSIDGLTIGFDNTPATG